MLALALPILIAAAVPATQVPSSVCPSGDRAPIVSSAPGAGKSLVPRGAVSLTVCRYNGLRGDPNSIQGVAAYKLVGVGTTGDHGTIARVTAELDATRPMRAGVAYGCPADFGAKLVAYFVYRSHPGDAVTVGLSGCNTITNGHVRRLGRGASVIAQLTGLAPRLVSPGTTSPPQSPGEPTVPIWEPGIA